ncbi:MAG TPA: 8-amino-7-oxononanoate synthase [Nitrospirota bacterium]|nr:8-amino-7-oxononanoate synthase [Nitrospirota bacterium]
MFEQELGSLKELGLLRELRTAVRVDGVRAVIEGRGCVLFCTNDYLGLASHPAVAAAARASMDRIFGAGSAPLIAGRTPYHDRLEKDVASFKGAEAALLFGSGYLANVGLIPAVACEGDVIMSDSLNHASVIDGCRLSRADIKIYPHCDVQRLERLLKCAGNYRRRVIVTEGVFGMDGDVAPLPEIAALARQYDALLVVDEAHSTGVLGRSGRGTFEHFGTDAHGAIQMGTLGKAVGSYGAFVAAGAGTVSWLVNSARSFMFSTALPPAVCASASAGLRVIRDEPPLRARLHENAEALRAGLNSLGYKVSGAGTPIIPIFIGGADDAVKKSARLFELGFFAPAIRPPTVPEGESRIRFTVSALHAREDIEALLYAMGKL